MTEESVHDLGDIIEPSDILDRVDKVQPQQSISQSIEPGNLTSGLDCDLVVGHQSLLWDSWQGIVSHER